MTVQVKSASVIQGRILIHFKCLRMLRLGLVLRAYPTHWLQLAVRAEKIFELFSNDWMHPVFHFD